MKILRPVLFLVALAALAYGIFLESHAVSSSKDDPNDRVKEYTGLDFVQAASVDRLRRSKDGVLYDPYAPPKSIPEKAPAPDTPAKKDPLTPEDIPDDCPT